MPPVDNLAAIARLRPQRYPRRMAESHPKRALSILLLSGASFIATSPRAFATSSPPGSQPGALDGHWVLSAATIDGDELDLVVPGAVRLDLAEPSFGGISGCNIYGGEFEQSPGKVDFGGFFQTERGCAGDLNALESAYTAQLHRLDTAQREGAQLHLSGEGVELHFEERPAVPLEELRGVEWELSGLERRQDGSVDSWGVEGTRSPTLKFGDDASISGSTPCRTFTGSYAVVDERIQTHDLEWKGSCSDAQLQDDAHIEAVLALPLRTDVYLGQLSLVQDQGLGMTYSNRDAEFGLGCSLSRRGSDAWTFLLLAPIGLGLRRRQRGRPDAVKG